MHKITLTFDNGPTPDVTPYVLDVLSERNLPAWFCLVGRQLMKDEAPALAKRALEAGHHLVNHSLTHQVPLGNDASVEHATREIREMHELMETSLGNWGEYWFRPFGRGGQLGPHLFSQAALNIFEELNYSALLWNSVPRDWEDTNGWVETALKDVEANEHTVVVLHDLPTGAMTQLPRFLDELERLNVLVTDALPADCIPIRKGIGV
ncbi:MAG: polysaccharide deacetylase family protein [Pseudomonadota bacterium]